MTLLQRITDVVIAIGNDMKKTIQKTEDGKYPALDGSNITNLVLQVTELEEDPNIANLVNGKMWLKRKQAVGGIIQPHGLVPMFTNYVDTVDLKIKTSKGVGEIKINY
jgi:hypothetical protein